MRTGKIKDIHNKLDCTSSTWATIYSHDNSNAVEGFGGHCEHGVTEYYQGVTVRDR